MKIASKRLPIDVGLPSICLIQLARIVHLLEPLPPNVEKVSKGYGMAIWRLDMDHPITGVRMEPVEARVIGRNTDIPRNRHFLPVNIHRDVGMNVKVSMFIIVTRDTICCGIGSVGGRLAPHNHEIDKDSNSEYADSYDADNRDAPGSSGASPLFFSPPLFLSAVFLSRELTRALLTHKS